MAQWEPTAKRFVAFLDIMGFKDMVFRNSHELVLKTLESFKTEGIDVIDTFAKMQSSVDKKDQPFKDAFKPLFGDSIIKTVSFSDSILVISNDDSYYSAYQLVWLITILLGNALITGVPIKGSIAHGEQTADFEKSIHFGKPLIDAYELQNQLHLYGVVLHHTAEQQFNSVGAMKKLENDSIHKYKTPMKQGEINHYLVTNYPDLKSETNLEAKYSKLYSTVSGHTRLYVDHTIEFLEFLAKKKQSKV